MVKNIFQVNSLMEIIALSGIIVSGIIFFAYAKIAVRGKISVKNFLLTEQGISGSEFANTFAAAGVSLASNIIFFIAAHRDYGYLMGIGPLFYCLVQFFLLYLVNSISLDFSKIRSIADIWYSAFSEPIIAKCIAFLSAMTCIMSVFVELLVGSEILSIFLPDTALHKALSFFFLGVVVVGYVRYGGYKAIIKTDTYQFILMLFSTIAIIYFSVTSPNLSHVSIKDITTKIFAHEQTGNTMFIFLFWVCMLNVFGAVTDISLWQRMAASSSSKEALCGFLKGLWKWGTIFLLPMMCFVLLYVKGNYYDTMPEFLHIVKSQSGVIGNLTFPLIVVGFTAALFSTADTQMIAAVYSLCDQHTFLSKLEQVSDNEKEKTIRKYLTIFFIVLFSLLSVFYYIEYTKISKWIVPIMYAVWGEIAILAPLIIYSLYKIKNKKTTYTIDRAQSLILLGFLILGWFIILLGSFTTEHLYAQLSFILASLVVCLGLFLTTFARVGRIVGSAKSCLPIDYS
jgi:Na+/proline symporter